MRSELIFTFLTVSAVWSGRWRVYFEDETSLIAACAFASFGKSSAAVAARGVVDAWWWIRIHLLSPLFKWILTQVAQLPRRRRSLWCPVNDQQFLSLSISARERKLDHASYLIHPHAWATVLWWEMLFSAEMIFCTHFFLIFNWLWQIGNFCPHI